VNNAYQSAPMKNNFFQPTAEEQEATPAHAPSSQTQFYFRAEQHDPNNPYQDHKPSALSPRLNAHHLPSAPGTQNVLAGGNTINNNFNIVNNIVQVQTDTYKETKEAFNHTAPLKGISNNILREEANDLDP